MLEGNSDDRPPQARQWWEGACWKAALPFSVFSNILLFESLIIPRVNVLRTKASTSQKKSEVFI